MHFLLERGGLFATLGLLLAGFSAAPTMAFENNLCTGWEERKQTSPMVMEIRLTGDVGPDMAHQLFAEIDDHLSSYPTLNTIKILLSSIGGEVESGFMIHNYLQGLHQRHGLQVITHNVGSVQSAAVDIYCAGNQRITSPYTFFMVHDGQFELDKGAYDVKAVQDLDEENVVTSNAGYALFSACTNLTVTDVDKMFTEQTYIDPDQALELGLAHSIQPATFDRTADIRCLIETTDEEEGN
jgi:ATP-dependent protease ClpP protease subunit